MKAKRKPSEVMCINCDEMAEHEHTMLCAYCARDWKYTPVKQTTLPKVRVSS